MKNRYTKSLVAILALALIGVSSLSVSVNAKAEKADKKSAPAASQTSWQVRCAKPEKDGAPATQCEMFQRLTMEESKQRVAEFAIGFPPEQKVASGVVILPLGVLLPPGGEMQIDDGKSYKFQFRYCTNAGCFAHINLNDKLLKAMGKGETIQFKCKALNGQNVEVKMSLAAFNAALSRVRPSKG